MARNFTHQLLMTPGPTMVPERILKAMSEPIVHHRTSEFTEFMQGCVDGMKKLFRTENEVYILTGSGTVAMDASIANIIEPGDEMLSLVSGKFSERLCELGEAYGAKVTAVDFEWGKKLDLGKLEASLTEKTKLVTVVHNETSTGVKNPIKDIAKIVHEKSNAILVVDTISSLGGDDIRVDEWDVDVCVSGSQKCLALPPGLAFITLNSRAWDAVEKAKSTKYYVDLKKYKKKQPQTPFTSGISLYYALDEALTMIEEEGLENRINRHAENAKYCRTRVKEAGLEIFPESEDICSNTLTSVRNDKASEIRAKLRDEHSILVAGAQAHMKGKMFRIGHMGMIQKEHIDKTMDAIEKVLKEV